MRAIATIGYEGITPERFDEMLEEAGVEVLIDVRAVAVSRRRGFSKRALAARMEAANRNYIHLRDLGDPKDGRLAARSGNMVAFRRIFSTHLETPAAQAALDSLAEIAAERSVALLCYEADAAGCHRAIVAERIAKLENLEILHLPRHERRRGYGADYHFGESVAQP